MGRNKELRKKIAARRKVAEKHEEKIRRERMKAEPDEGVIRAWQHEIAAARNKIDSLTRRLQREWWCMTTKTAPRLETVERLIEDVEEWYERIRKIRQKMSGVERGSDPYQDLLSELSVYLDWLKMKAEVAAEAIDEYQETLPEDD